MNLLFVLFLTTLPARAQDPVTGLQYYAVEKLDDQIATERGKAGSLGIAFDRLILAPNTRYRIWLLEAATLRVADATFTTPDTGSQFTFPDFLYRQANPWDTDGDGLPDIGEFILGTGMEEPDTDGDGVSDGAEVRQGTNPLDGILTATGVVGLVDTPGTAVDVCGLNDIIAVADSPAGVTVFNVFNAMDPVRIAQVDTPGMAERVACGGNRIVVADGRQGLAVVDITDPPAARILHQVNLGGGAQGVAVAAGLAFVGLSEGAVVSVDVETGTVLQSVSLPGSVRDLRFGGDHLYALTDGMLHAISVTSTGMTVQGSTASPFVTGPNRRLFAGGGVAYAVHGEGYNTFSLANPSQPVLITASDTEQFGWKQIVLNGSGLGVAAVSPNSTFDGPHDISVYDTSNPSLTDELVTTHETPGIARAVAICNGLAYVADHDQGLSVLNYLSFDTMGLSPVITLDASFSLDPAEVEEASLARVTANVTDDVQVRNVEFFVDDVRLASDGDFPFEHRFITPRRLNGKTSFRLRLRASDTGGNATFTDEIVVALVADATPPQVARQVPADGAIRGGGTAVGAFFNEPMDPDTLLGPTFTLSEAGADGVHGTGDDVPVAGTAEYREISRSVFFAFAGSLPQGRYRATIDTTATDLAGNALAEPVSWSFSIFDPGGPDSDGDGVPDFVEEILGLNPNNEDSDGDSIPDGDEDFDSDGLPNAGEIVLGTDPARPDTDGDGILDGDEDRDRDTLSNGDEFTRRTNALDYDTDDDGWGDGTEVAEGSDPLDPSSVPETQVILSAVGIGIPDVFSRPVRVDVSDSEAAPVAGGGAQ